MTRITLWALSTLSVVVLLFGYHTSTMGPSVASSSPPAAYSGTVAGTTDSTSDSSGSAGTSSGTTSSDGDLVTDGSAASGTAGAAGTFTGASMNTQWGPVQVAITVGDDGSITDVSVPVYPSGNPKDDEINSYALPILIQSTLDAQSADIDMVSGATVTSVGYEGSLQSALDQAGL